MTASVPAAAAQGPARRLARDALAGALVGLAALSFYISSASLIFQGALASHVPEGIAAALLGGALLSLFAARRSGLPLVSAGAVPATVPVLAAMLAGVSVAAPPGAVLATAVAALALTAVVIGAAWWLMGVRGWGDLASYIPYPVAGGFIASTGWLLATGGMGVVAHRPKNWADLAAWLRVVADARLAAVVAIALALWFVARRLKHPLAVPAAVVLLGLGVHAVLAAAGLDTAAARGQGWLPAAFETAAPVQPWRASLWAAVDWKVLLQQSGWVLSAVIVGTLSLLMTVSSLEVAWQTRADINRELRTLGQANLLAGLLGGLQGSYSLSRSLLNRQAGAQGRASGVVLGGLCLATMVVGGPLISLAPLPLLGGLLLAQGLDMLKTWLLDSRRRMNARDHLTIVAMVSTTAVLGFLPAVSLGVLVCCFNFAATQSRHSPIRRIVSRTSWLSRVERPVAPSRWLMSRGQGLRIVELQGVLFFGSARWLSRALEAVLDEPEPPRRLVLDFARVRTVDSSAAQSLMAVVRAASAHGVELAVSGLHEEQSRAMQSAGFSPGAGLVAYADIDDAVEAWDQLQLAQVQAPLGASAGAQAALHEALGEPFATRLLPLLERVGLSAGQALFEAGDASDAMYLVDTGRIAIVLHESTVRTVLPGSLIGEMGLFRGQPRSATARAVEYSMVLKLSAGQLTQLEKQMPELAVALHRMFVLQMACRVDQLTAQAYATGLADPPAKRSGP